MNLTEVEMHADTFEEPLSFVLKGSRRKGQYEVRQILGLDADEIFNSFYGVGDWTTSLRYYEPILKPREIVIRVILKPRFNLDESYGDIRDELYKYISKTRTGEIDLHFKSNATTVSHIIGRIVKFEAVHFTKLPEVQITVSCKDPIFKGLTQVTHENIDSVDGVITITDSLSTSPHGFVLEGRYNTDWDAYLSIQDKAQHSEWSFGATGPSNYDLDIGDMFYLSSEKGNKYYYYTNRPNTQYEVTRHLMNTVYPNSVWPIIFPGINTFYLERLKEGHINQLKISYYPTYWGI